MRQIVIMKIKCAVHYRGQVKHARLDPKKDLLTSLRKAGIPVPFSCGGEGICTTCRIFLKKGELTPPNSLEAERAEERGYEKTERLSCQCHPLSSEIEIQLP